jgi:hypothetical protein
VGILRVADDGVGGGGGGEGGVESGGGELGRDFDPFAGGGAPASPASTPAPPATPSAPAPPLPASPPPPAPAPGAAGAPAPPARRASLGDDGFGGIDDTDDVLDAHGSPLMTCAPPSSGAVGAAAAARAASAANTNALAVRLALPAAAEKSEDLTLVLPAAVGAGAGAGGGGGGGGGAPFFGHLLLCGTADAMGFLLRAVGALLPGGLSPARVVVLAPSKPPEGALNAFYAGAGALLGAVTFLAGSPADPSDLLRAGVLGARAAVVLTQNKAAASADGADNLSDDTEAILVTSVIHKLNPVLHVVTELLHGSHAPFVKPAGSTLNDAQRAAFAYILEEREAARQRGAVDAAMAALEAEGRVAAGARREAPPMAALRARLLGKLASQAARLAALHGAARGAAARGDGAIDARATDGLASGAADPRAELDSAFSALSTADIVDVLIGVKEEFGGGGGGGGGASKGSGATNDLFTSPAFAAGRVFSFATMDSVVCVRRHKREARPPPRLYPYNPYTQHRAPPHTAGPRHFFRPPLLAW